MLLIYQVLMVIVILPMSYFVWLHLKYHKLNTKKLPGLKGLPLVGCAHLIKNKEDSIYMLRKTQLVFGYKALFWLGPVPFFIVSDPPIVQEIFTSPQCVNKSFLYAAVEDATGSGLFSSKDPEWSVHRKLLNPAFGHKVLLSFFPIFNKEVNALMETINSILGIGEIDLLPVLQKFTLNIASQTTMGKRMSDESRHSNIKNSLLDAFQCVQNTVTEKIFAPWLNFKLLYWLLRDTKPYTKAKTEIRQFVSDLIDETTKSDAEVTEASHNVFINRAINLLKKGDFNWKNVEDESIVIVFGAFETTATTIYYTLMLLAMFPQYQEKCFEEIKSLFPNSGVDFDVSYADIQQMSYMDMVLNESMRVIATVPIVARQATAEVKLSNGIVLPKGVQIAIDIFNMHRREDIWGAYAHVFNPDNFLPSNMKNKHPYAFIPFTKGIRSCIGWRYALMSIKVAMAKLLRNYRFTTKIQYDDLRFVGGVPIKLKERPLLEVHLRDE